MSEWSLYTPTYITFHCNKLNTLCISLNQHNTTYHFKLTNQLHFTKKGFISPKTTTYPTVNILLHWSFYWLSNMTRGKLHALPHLSCMHHPHTIICQMAAAMLKTLFRDLVGQMMNLRLILLGSFSWTFLLRKHYRIRPEFTHHNVYGSYYGFEF